MENKEIQNRKTEIITDIICDSCGKSCKVDEGIVDNDMRLDKGEKVCVYEFMKLEVHWGYYSDKDCEKWTAQVCEKCVDEKFTFVKFQKENYI